MMEMACDNCRCTPSEERSIRSTISRFTTTRSLVLILLVPSSSWGGKEGGREDKEGKIVLHDGEQNDGECFYIHAFHPIYAQESIMHK